MTLREMVTNYIATLPLPDSTCHFYAVQGMRAYGRDAFWALYDELAGTANSPSTGD